MFICVIICLASYFSLEYKLYEGEGSVCIPSVYRMVLGREWVFEESWSSPLQGREGCLSLSHTQHETSDRRSLFGC